MPKPKDVTAALAASDFGDFKETSDDPEEIQGGDLPTTLTPSGTTIPLMNDEEVIFYNNISQRYQEDNKFTNVSDLLELDRLLSYELMCFRWNNWLLKGTDYSGGLVMAGLQKDIQLYSREIRDIKAGLGIDKKTRDRDKGGSIAEYIEMLKLRAGEFVVHRNTQYAEIMTMWKELEAKITLYNNTTPTEKTEFECHAADIFDWLAGAFKKINEIDDKFREEQKVWLRGELN